MMPKNEVFLDTSYVIALSSKSDQYHEQAVKLANQLEKNKTQLITTVLTADEHLQQAGFQVLLLKT